METITKSDGNYRIERTTSERKYVLEGINSRLDTVKVKIIYWNNRNNSNWFTKRKKINNKNPRDIWNNIKQYIHITEEKREREEIDWSKKKCLKK